jgi:signal transduction histidine kinase
VRVRHYVARVPQGAQLRDLIQLSRLITEPTGRGAILPEVARLAASDAGADAALVLLVEGELARVRAAYGCGDQLPDWTFDADELGPEVEASVLDKCRAHDGDFAASQSAALISDGALFGEIVILFKKDKPVTKEAMTVLSWIADIAAVSLSTAAQFERIERVNAELKATRAVLERTDKLRALGEMAAGIDHDLKNILNPLGLYVQLAKRQLDADQKGDVKASLDEMKGVVGRGIQLLESLRHFSRQSPDVVEHLADLDALAREAITIARPRMSSGKKALPFVVEDLHSPPQVLARTGEIVSAIVNLLANAQDALERGGTITVRTGEEAARAFVEVEDTGPGMTPEVRDRVFDPFFTTKGEEGTGWGSRWFTRRWFATTGAPRSTATSGKALASASGSRSSQERLET